MSRNNNWQHRPSLLFFLSCCVSPGITLQSICNNRSQNLNLHIIVRLQNPNLYNRKTSESQLTCYCTTLYRNLEKNFKLILSVTSELWFAFPKQLHTYYVNPILLPITRLIGASGEEQIALPSWGNVLSSGRFGFPSSDIKIETKS